MKVCFETFGCRLNRAEALEEEAKYLARGWERTESHKDADLIVVRGCSVTARAQRDCERLIEHIRGKYPLKRVLVTGCLPSANKNYTLRDFAARTARRAAPTNTNAAFSVPMRTARAYLKVQDGCSGRCTFCIVPQFRGKSTSVPFDDVLARARAFLDAGFHELVITGCNLTQYNDAGRLLPELIAALSDLCGETARLRLGSVEPGPVAKNLIQLMAERKNICRFLHIPVQSGSDRILSAMRRPYKRRDVEELVKEAARLMPDLGLGCDIMTGFPDEMDNDFLATKFLLTRLPFTKAHVFPYSERPGTVAATLPNAVPKEIRSLHAREIADQMEDARTRYIKRFKGRTVQVLVEDEKTLAGWTSEYVWCQVGEDKAKVLTRDRGTTERRIRRRDLINVLVREAHGHVLTGDPV